MKEKIIPFAIGAGVAGVLVWWWIKRSCGCQHAAASASSSAAVPRVAAAESTGGLDDTGEDGASAVGFASGELFPDQSVINGADAAIGGDLFPGGSSGATSGGTFDSGGCTSCSGRDASVMTAPTFPTAPGPRGGLRDFQVTGVTLMNGGNIAAGPVLL